MSLALRLLPTGRVPPLAMVLRCGKACASGSGMPSRLIVHSAAGRASSLSTAFSTERCLKRPGCCPRKVFACAPTTRRSCANVVSAVASEAGSAASGADKATEQRLPVMLLSGFLGAGKTTTLKHILNNQKGLKVAVVVNDVADLNIDQKMLKSANIEEMEMLELSNGCMCCSLRNDLVAGIMNIAKKNAYDLLIIEGTGVALPLPVAASFASDPDLIDAAYLDTVTTVVDAPRFISDVIEAQDLEEVGMGEHEDDTRVVSDILVEQVESADMLLINKTDCITEPELEQVTALLKELNPKAKVLASQHGKVPLEEIVLTRRFDFHEISDAAGWVNMLNEAVETGHHHRNNTEDGHDHDHHDHDHDHEHHRSGSVHGICSFVYIARRPFHPGRLAEELETPWEGLLRSKGFFWLATRNELRGMWQTAGQAWSAEYCGEWDAAMTAEERGVGDEDIVEAGWDPVWGDRMQELVFIGIGMDEDKTRGRLNRCLLTDEEMEMGPDGWVDNIEDPLPEWYVDYGEVQEVEVD